LSNRTGISPSWRRVSGRKTVSISHSRSSWQNAPLALDNPNSRAAVGVKNAGIPAPAALILSARVPCGQSSMASSPDRYFFSRTLLFPRYESTSRSTWPELVRVARPPFPS
jgi:hypothetical protein